MDHEIYPGQAMRASVKGKDLTILPAAAARTGNEEKTAGKMGTKGEEGTP